MWSEDVILMTRATHITNIYLLKINSLVQLYIYFEVHRSSVQINTCTGRFTWECNSRVNMITTSIKFASLTFVLKKNNI